MIEVEVRQVNESEIWIGESKDLLIEENILLVEAVGEQTPEIAEKQLEVTGVIAKSINRKLNFIIDLNRCGKNSPEARNIWSRIAEKETTGKVAVFGIHPVARVIASFVINVSKKGKEGAMRFFRTKEESLSWIKE